MGVFTIALIVLGGVVVLGVAGIAVLAVLHRLAADPGRSPVRPVSAEALDPYFARGAGFAVTAQARTSLSCEEVYRRLVAGPYLSTLPFLSGPRWTDGGGASGAHRTMSGWVFSVTEEVVVDQPGAELALSGVAVCLPLAIESFAERFVIVAGEGGSRVVSWTIAGTPRWVGWLPWRLLAPVARPFFAFVLRHILRRTAFRSAR
ncbi:hypothetical protein [Gordonia sp. (in: high G+C Gram-positive bacteria)]|uniref:hypothetical protein n=1 Tax=Gordonia sp. (in: high G+C Gram-positive bacteria) TaxID=84139 RepID=UPI003526CA7F